MGHVARTMHLMSSGSAVMSARNGSMGSVSKSLLQGPSILSSTNVRHAAIREHGLDSYWVGGIFLCILGWWILLTV